MDAGEPVQISTDLADIKEKEQNAIAMILAGMKKIEAINKSNLPYQYGDKNYRRLTKRAGLTNGMLYFLLVVAWYYLILVVVLI